MKINKRFANCILLIIPLAIYGTELLFWFMMMGQNKFPSDYNSWRAMILFTIVVMIAFGIYTNITSDRLLLRLMTMLTPVIGYIIAIVYAAFVTFIFWDTTLFNDRIFDLFNFCFAFSYIIPILIWLVRGLGPVISG